MAGPREPPLQQRPGGRQHDERQAGRHREHAQQPQGRLGVGRRGGVVGQAHRQRDQRQDQQRQVQPGLPTAAQPAGRDVDVGVGDEQQHLEEEGAGVPDRRRAAIGRQDELGEHRLDEEQQRRAQEGRGTEEEHHPVSLADHP
ncbi:MAG TPA: hypothetical protein VK640_06425 [Actinomycetes bacterium]|nr:hypothetical protein [Actinomycetes bacterium]